MQKITDEITAYAVCTYLYTINLQLKNNSLTNEIMNIYKTETYENVVGF